MVVGVCVSVAEECGEEVDLRGKGFPSLESCAFAIETDAMSPVLLDTACLRYDDWSERCCHGLLGPASVCGMTYECVREDG